jgi:tetratricopeptide (TPR) repeat protein
MNSGSKNHDSECSEADAKFSSLLDELQRQRREQLTKPINDCVDFADTLKELDRAYNEAWFENEVKIAATNLYGFLVTNPSATLKEYLGAMPLLYELNDIFHFGDLHKDVLLRGKSFYDGLRELQIDWSNPEQIPLPERESARQQVLYCACWANELKRNGESQQAKKIFEWLRHFTREIATDNFPCFRTQATLTYQLGSLYRILEQHDLAESTFTQTLSLLHDRSREAPGNEQAGLIRRQAMVVGIGFGWVNYTRGFLRRAENALASARALLASSNDPIIPWYIELLYGTILRCRAGTKAEDLNMALNILKGARDEFERRGNARYVSRASWEIALAHNLAGEYEAAQRYLDEVKKYTEQSPRPKWKTNVQILQSRQLRGQGEYDQALKHARRALMIATTHEATLSLIDACLAQGEAKLELAKTGAQRDQNIASAMSDFERARDLVSESKIRHNESSLPSNPKIVAVCELRIAQCLAMSGEELEARSHLSTWQILGPSVEHEWVRELARTVTEEIKQLSLNFTVSSENPNEWNYSKNIANLRQWLLRQSLRQTGRNYSEAAKLLGVKRATLYQWQADTRKTRRARTTN